MWNLANLVAMARWSGPQATTHAVRVCRASSPAAGRPAPVTAASAACQPPAPAPVPVRPSRPGAWASLAIVVLAPLASLPAAADHDRGFESTADGRLVDVQVQVEGRTVPLYLAPDGSARRYFQAFKGRRYALVLTNTTGRRIGALIAVDGLNVVNGQRSRLSADEAMYVLDPWERTVIRGWRTSLNDVRRFVFVDEERSYASRTGQANGDLGWVRVLAFHERGRRWIAPAPGRINEREGGVEDDAHPRGWLEEPRGETPRAKADEAPQAGRTDRPLSGAEPREAAPETQGREGAAPESSGPVGDELAPRKSSGSTRTFSGYRDVAPSVPGTGWGERRWDPVRRVWFVPERHATDHLVLRYEYASGLRALGIFPRRFRDRVWERDAGQLGFAQPPRW